jgi:hypothetical protein
MIRRVGVIYQDVISLGFLEGFKKRLACDAELLTPPAGVGTTRNMTRRQARRAWTYFRKKAADVIVRFTDADRARWQQVRRDEIAVFPEPARSLLVCGIAVNNVEEWLSIDPGWLAGQLDIEAAALRNDPRRSDVLKDAIRRKPRPGERISEVVEKLVLSAPNSVFKRWLEDPALAAFYDDCRRIAELHGCQLANLRG